MDELVERYALQPHPEGGWFRETYRAAATLPGTDRSVCTAIYYLLGAGERSRLHRIDADEVWHFYGGDALLVVELGVGADGRARVTRLDAARPQLVVAEGTSFGALLRRTQPSASWVARSRPVSSSPPSNSPIARRCSPSSPTTPR